MITLDDLKRLPEEELRRRLHNQFQLEEDEIDVLYPTTDKMAEGYFERLRLATGQRSVKVEDTIGYDDGVDDYVPQGANAALAEQLVKEDNARELRESLRRTGADVSTEEVAAAMAALNEPSSGPTMKVKKAKSKKSKKKKD